MCNHFTLSLPLYLHLSHWFFLFVFFLSVFVHICQYVVDFSAIIPKFNLISSNRVINRKLLMRANSQLVWNFKNLNKLQLLKNMQIQAFLVFNVLPSSIGYECMNACCRVWWRSLFDLLDFCIIQFSSWISFAINQVIANYLIDINTELFT